MILEKLKNNEKDIFKIKLKNMTPFKIIDSKNRIYSCICPVYLFSLNFKKWEKIDEEEVQYKVKKSYTYKKNGKRITCFLVDESSIKEQIQTTIAEEYSIRTSSIKRDGGEFYYITGIYLREKEEEIGVVTQEELSFLQMSEILYEMLKK